MGQLPEAAGPDQPVGVFVVVFRARNQRIYADQMRGVDEFSASQVDAYMGDPSGLGVAEEDQVSAA